MQIAGEAMDLNIYAQSPPWIVRITRMRQCRDIMRSTGGANQDATGQWEYGYGRVGLHTGLAVALGGQASCSAIVRSERNKSEHQSCAICWFCLSSYVSFSLSRTTTSFPPTLAHTIPHSSLVSSSLHDAPITLRLSWIRGPGLLKDDADL